MSWDSFAKWVQRMFQEHAFMRRFVLFWAMAMITYYAYFLMIQRGGMTDNEAKAFLGIIGTFATASTIYMWNRK